MSSQAATTDAPTELPIASMETLMAQLGVAKPNTAIVGSATNAQEQSATDEAPQSQSQ